MKKITIRKGSLAWWIGLFAIASMILYVMYWGYILMYLSTL